MSDALIEMALHTVSAASGAALTAWIFWRINETYRRDNWFIKVLLATMFAAAVGWTIDQVQGNTWTWDGASLVWLVTTYLWWGVWRHRHADRRTYRAPPGCPIELAPPSCPVRREPRP
jgi:hypothetical protein